MIIHFISSDPYDNMLISELDALRQENNNKLMEEMSSKEEKINKLEKELTKTVVLLRQTER